MALDSFAALKESVQKWCARTDVTFSNQIETFVQMAEMRMFHGAGAPGEDTYTPPLRVKELEEDATLTATSGVATLPSDVLAVRKIYPAGKRVGLEYKPPERFDVREAQSSSSNPQFYTVEGSSLLLQGGYSGSVDFLYFKEPAGIRADNGTGDLLTAYPVIYLELALFYAFTFMRDMMAAKAHLDLAKSAIEGANLSAGKARRSGAMTSVQPRVAIP